MNATKSPSDSVPFDDHAPADEQHRRLREQRQERRAAARRTRAAGSPARSGRRPPRSAARTSSCSAVLLRERLDDVDADDVLLGDRRDVGHLLLHVAQHAGARRGCSGRRPRSSTGAIASAISASFQLTTKRTIVDADDREDVLEEEDQPVAEEEADAPAGRRSRATSAGRSGGGRRSRTRGGRASRRARCACRARRRAPACPAISRRPDHQQRPRDADDEHDRADRATAARVLVVVVERVDDARRSGDAIASARSLRADREHDRDASDQLVRPQEPEQAHEGRAVARACLGHPFEAYRGVARGVPSSARIERRRRPRRARGSRATLSQLARARRMRERDRRRRRPSS